MLTQNQIATIEAHLTKAVTKHPQLCTELLSSGNIGEYVKYDRICHDAYDENPCAENALQEEVAEVLLAIAQGDREHAILECYDTIAVLLRIIDEVRK